MIAGLDRSQRRVGVLASSATVKAQIYSARLRMCGFEVVEPTAERQGLRVDAGAEVIVLGCTEFPIAMRGQSWTSRTRLLDATRALARACVVASAPASLLPLSETRESPFVSA